MLHRLLYSVRVRHACEFALPLMLFAVLVASAVRVEQPELPRFGDKIEHAAAFALLTALAALGHPRWPLARAVAPALLGYGMLLECIQWGLPWREFSLLDWFADVAGVATCALVIGRMRQDVADHP